MKTCNYLKLSTSQWAWGASVHWRLYYSLKTFGKRCSTYINVAHENHKKDQDYRRRPHYRQGKRFRHTSSPDSPSFLPEADELKLTDKEANEIIRKNETVVEFSEAYVEKCEINQLGSNEPSEDQVFVTRSAFKEGLLFGVLDGHGGPLFVNYMKTRLPYYIHASLADKFKIVQNSNTAQIGLVENLMKQNQVKLDENDYWVQNLHNYMNELTADVPVNNDPNVFPGNILSYVSTPIRQLFGKDIINDSGLALENGIQFGAAIREAFIRIDDDMISELVKLSEENKLGRDNIGLATSGCCALVAYLIENELHIANLGDCRAVLGSSTNGVWSAVQLTYDHTSASNSSEVQRILSEHPTEEARSCLSYGRLLGRLAPLRALGDFQFKLTNEQLIDIFKVVPKYTPFSTSFTPPYLSAEPEVFHYKLEPNDRFVVLASDGLWDMLANDDVVKLVAAYIEERRIEVLKDQAHFYSVPNFADINTDLFDDTLNENVASFLIRQALGGYDQGNLNSMLAMKYPDVRLYRDDISVLVIFLKDRSNEDSVSEVPGPSTLTV